MKPLLLVTLIAVLTPMAVFANGARDFLFLKTGEKFATQEIAGPTVATLTAYLGDQLGLGSNAYAPQVLNDPAAAVTFCAQEKPPLGIVTPGFYNAYAKAFQLKPLLEIERENVGTERFVLVCRKDNTSKLEQLAGKSVATTLAAEERYVVGVILQDKLTKEVRLQPTTDVEGAVFDMLDKIPDAADAVLMEEAIWKILFEPDPEIAEQLNVVHRSEELPGNLVVKFGAHAEGLEVDKLKSVLTGMGASEAGKSILRSIRVKAFRPVNQERLDQARSRFLGKKP